MLYRMVSHVYVPNLVHIFLTALEITGCIGIMIADFRTCHISTYGISEPPAKIVSRPIFSSRSVLPLRHYDYTDFNCAPIWLENVFPPPEMGVDGFDLLNGGSINETPKMHTLVWFSGT